MPPTRSRFGVHPTLEAALCAVAEESLPADIDVLLPAQRRMSSDELVAIGRLCITHVEPRVGRTQRAEVARITALVDRFLAQPPAGPGDQKAWLDLGAAARRDAEYARGPLKVAALTAYAASESGVDAARLIGESARLTARTLAKDPPALHAFLRALCARFR